LTLLVHGNPPAKNINCFASLCGICGIETGEFQLVRFGSFLESPKTTDSLWNGSTQGLSHVIQSAAPQFVQVVETEPLNVPGISRHPTKKKRLSQDGVETVGTKVDVNAYRIFVGGLRKTTTEESEFGYRSRHQWSWCDERFPPHYMWIVAYIWLLEITWNIMELYMDRWHCSMDLMMRILRLSADKTSADKCFGICTCLLIEPLKSSAQTVDTAIVKLICF
jgi:hypothetical protein